MQLQSEKLTGGLFEETEEQAAPTPLVNMVSSDVSTLNMLKYGMLALQLLPENSSAGRGPFHFSSSSLFSLNGKTRATHAVTGSLIIAVGRMPSPFLCRYNCDHRRSDQPSKCTAAGVSTGQPAQWHGCLLLLGAGGSLPRQELPGLCALRRPDALHRTGHLWRLP